MNILTFDTCFAACSAAVGVGMSTAHEKIISRFEPMQTGHAERLIAMVGEVMTEAGIVFADLNRIGVTIGPGSFVGTRVGVSAARAFSLASGAPVISVTSLAAMARKAALILRPATDICVVVDVRHNEVYAQVFDQTGLIARTVPQLLALHAAAEVGLLQPLVYVGTAAERVVGLIPNQSVTAELLTLLPDASDLIVPVSQSGQSMSPATPLYLRPPDAKPPMAAALQRR